MVSDIPKFSIHYNDGSVVQGGGEDDDTVTLTFSRKWLEAPSDGIACIVSEAANTGRTVHDRAEFYYQLPLNSHGVGYIGHSMKIGAYLRQLSIVKYGGWTGDENFNNIRREASTGEYIPKKSARLRPLAEDESD